MNDKSKSAQQAEDYIRYTTKQDVKQKDLVDENGNIKVDRRTSKTINHAALANDFIKLVSMVPMSPISRKIMQMKIINPGISMTGVSLQTGLLAHEIKAYENEGVNRIIEFLRKTSLEDAKEKFNSDSAVEYAVKNLNLQGKDNSLLK